MKRADDPELRRLLAEFADRGDASAMDHFVRRTRPRLLAVARSIGAPQDAEDSVQAAYYSLLRRGTELDGAPPLAWLMTAVVRISYRRKALAKREHEIARRLDRGREPDQPPRQLIRSEQADQIRAEIARLPSKYRDVVVLRDLEGLSSVETADLLEIPTSTVTTRHRRAKRMLRTALPAYFLYAVLILPWLVRDATYAAAPAGASLMKAKTVFAMTVIAGGAGLLGYSAADLGQSNVDRTPVRIDTWPARRVAELEMELAEARNEAEQYREQLTLVPTEAAGAADAMGAAPAVPTVAPVDPLVRVRKIASELDVPDDVLEVALKADDLLQRRDPEANATVHALALHGETGFRAVVALLRSGRGGIWISRKMLPATYAPGLEGLLIETAEIAELSRYAKGQAISGLRIADTAAVRDYLVARAERERDPSVFRHLVETLGEFGEDRGAPSCADKLIFDDKVQDADWSPYRTGILYRVGQMGGPNAMRVLGDYLRDPRVRDPDDILQALNGVYAIDKSACGEIARTILEGPRGEAFEGDNRDILEVLASVR